MQKLEEKLARLHAIVESQNQRILSLERSVEDPDPAVDFGSRNEEYTFQAFRFAAKCLVAGSACSEIARLVEVFLEEFFPRRLHALRVPDRRQWEEWRMALLLHGRVRVLKLLQKMDFYHIAGDATTKGKSKKSRKTGIMQTAARGVKDGVVYPVILDLDIMRDGAAETEMRSMVAALKISFASGLQEEANILRAVSGTTDHADAATKSMVLFGHEKQKVLDNMSNDMKARLSPWDLKVVGEFKVRNCQTHLVNILSQNYVGGRHKPECTDQNPDKLAVTHGKAEFYIQSRLCAADILRRHIELAVGKYSYHPYLHNDKQLKTNVMCAPLLSPMPCRQTHPVDADKHSQSQPPHLL